MEWYIILFIVICCISAFGWIVFCIRKYKEWRDKKNGEPILTYLDYEPPILQADLMNPYA
jgi:hypothetical protein